MDGHEATAWPLNTPLWSGASRHRPRAQTPDRQAPARGLLHCGQTWVAGSRSVRGRAPAVGPGPRSVGLPRNQVASAIQVTACSATPVRRMVGVRLGPSLSSACGAGWVRNERRQGSAGCNPAKPRSECPGRLGGPDAARHCRHRGQRRAVEHSGDRSGVFAADRRHPTEPRTWLNRRLNTWPRAQWRRPMVCLPGAVGVQSWLAPRLRECQPDEVEPHGGGREQRSSQSVRSVLPSRHAMDEGDSR